MTFKRVGQTVSLRGSVCRITLAQGWCAACDEFQVVTAHG